MSTGSDDVDHHRMNNGGTPLDARYIPRALSPLRAIVHRQRRNQGFRILRGASGAPAPESESPRHPGSKPELPIVVADLRGTAVDEAKVWDDAEVVRQVDGGIGAEQQAPAGSRRR